MGVLELFRNKLKFTQRQNKYSQTLLEEKEKKERGYDSG